MSEPTLPQPVPDAEADAGRSPGTPAVPVDGGFGTVPEVTDPETVSLPEPDLAEPVLSAEVDDEDVQGALAEAGEVEGEAQRASSEVGGEVGPSEVPDTGDGSDLDINPTSGPH